MTQKLFNMHRMLASLTFFFCVSATMTLRSQEAPLSTSKSDPPLVRFLELLQPCLVKIYGAGGLRGLESYQTGILISDQGHVLTTWSTVLDVDKTRLITWDGKRWDGVLVGNDPRTELAVIQIQADGFPYFRFDADVSVKTGDRVFGLSNLFGIATGDEPTSVQRGVIMAIAPLNATRGRSQIPFRGDVLIVDAMTNNPGATGGALVNLEGKLVGVLGKELKDDRTNIWINYAIPVSAAAASARAIIDGKVSNADKEKMQIAARPHTSLGLGFSMLPDVLAKTPAFVDRVIPNSLADKAGLKPNDLILTLNSQRVDSRSNFEKQLATIDRADLVPLVVQRGEEILSIQIRP